MAVLAVAMLPQSATAAWRAVADTAGGAATAVTVAVPPAADSTATVAADTAALSVSAAAQASSGRGEAADTVAKTRLNKAEGFNALDYILERRYLNRGDDFSGSLFDHIFIYGGIGAEKLSAPSDAYRFNTLTDVHLGVGKQLSRLSTVRLGLHAGLGYQQGTSLLLGKVGARLDYLFNLSAYFDGYDPTRLFEVSTVLGVGGQGSHLRRNAGWKLSGEGHVGLQLKFYTGPQGSITLEPYIGIGTDQGDISEDRNWRKYDFFYGAGLSYVYYLDRNLTPRSRRRLIDGRSEADRLREDSVLQSWQQPWFVELAAGPHFMDAPEVGRGASLGHETALSVGKWLSPVIGARLTASVRSATWGERTESSPSPSYATSYTRRLHKAYGGVRLDALFNPLGFARNFEWDKPFGFYVFLGGELGRIVRYGDTERLNCYAWAYSAGAHLWARIDDGLQLFVEPRGSWYVYDIPYADANRSLRCTDAGMSINLGLTVSTYDRKYRRRPDRRDLSAGRLKAGIGGGTSLKYTRTALTGGGMDYVGNVWAEYSFDRVSSVRASFEYASLGVQAMTSFYDYNLAYPDEGYLRYTRSGVWHRRYGLGLVSLAYAINLSEAMSARSDYRRFELTAFAGPALVMLFGEKATIDASERVQQGHACEPVGKAGGKTVVGVNAGVRLSARITDRWGLYLAPAVYAWGGLDLPGVEFMQVRHLETLNLGVQYSF